jgi:hypothetical protein
LCDRFFHSAYGGSFLNHQWLIAAATPPWTAPIPSGFVSSYNSVTRVLKDNQLTFDGANAVNTIQPLFAPFSPGTAAEQQSGQAISLITRGTFRTGTTPTGLSPGQPIRRSAFEGRGQRTALHFHHPFWRQRLSNQQK